VALLYFLPMTPKLFKATDVCELAQLQPYVLRSWEKEFPGIGVQKADGQRLYRQSDVEQVLRIKQLVFTEGLTLSGARRRLEESHPVTAETGVSDDEVGEVLDALASDARTRIAHVRHGLQSILAMLSGEPGTRVVVVDDYQLEPPSSTTPVVAKPVKTRAAVAARRPESLKPGLQASPARGTAATPVAKRKRANA
jgi:DNA-binding transcriptional MerR regulator